MVKNLHVELSWILNNLVQRASSTWGRSDETEADDNSSLERDKSDNQVRT